MTEALSATPAERQTELRCPWTPVRRHAQVADIDIQTGSGEYFEFQREDMTLDCLFREKKGADRLFVVFTGAVDRDKYGLPAFARWNWTPILNGHLLCVGDPTLRLAPDLRLGWYVGTPLTDATDMAVDVAREIAHRLGIPQDRTIFYGSSGGGFAAIQAASRLARGRAVAINPQINLVTYPAAARLFEVLAPDMTPALAARALGSRADATAAMASARLKGRDLRLLLVQNLQDPVHLEKHFKPFCKTFGADPSGTLEGHGGVHTLLYDSPSGHGAEPVDVARDIATRGMDALLAD